VDMLHTSSAGDGARSLHHRHCYALLCCTLYRRPIAAPLLQLCTLPVPNRCTIAAAAHTPASTRCAIETTAHSTGAHLLRHRRSCTLY